MKKFLKIFLIILVFGILIFISFVKSENKKEDNYYSITNDSMEFKSDYEALNEEDDYLTISIKSYNPIENITLDEIFNILDKETSAILLGEPKSNLTRSIVPTLINTALDNNIRKIYYLDTTDIKEENNYSKLMKEIEDYLPSKSSNNPLVIFVKKGKILGIEGSLETYINRVKEDYTVSMNGEEKEELANIYKKYFKKID